MLNNVPRLHWAETY